jgi:hypothetical protein
MSAQPVTIAEQTAENRTLESKTNDKADVDEKQSQMNGHYKNSYESSETESSLDEYSYFETASINVFSLEKACQQAVEFEAERGVEAKYEAIVEQKVNSEMWKELRLLNNSSSSRPNNIYSNQDTGVRPILGSGIPSYLDSVGHTKPIAFSYDSSKQIGNAQGSKKYSYETTKNESGNKVENTPLASKSTNTPSNSILVRTSDIQSNQSKGQTSLQTAMDDEITNFKETDTKLATNKAERISSDIISNDLSLNSLTPGSSYTIQSGTKLRLDSTNSVQGLRFMFSNSNSEDADITSTSNKKGCTNTFRKEDYEEQTSFITKSVSSYCTTMNSTTQSKIL